MKTLLRIAGIICVFLLLPGCLEVNQYPGWRHGAYDGKPDNLPAQAYFHGDRLAWNAEVNNRTHLQNEYGRTGDPKWPPRQLRRAE